MQLTPTGRGSEVVERYRPDLGQCGCGRPFARRGVSRGYLRCTEGPHRTFRCRECGGVAYDPPHDPATDREPSYGARD